MNGITAWLQSLNWQWLWVTLITVAAALLCITFHELCHGLVAYKLGDPTAKRAGRLTLNPVKHIDIVGLAMMALFHVGWAKPVPVNAGFFKNPKRGMAVTALAGPVSNVLLAFLTGWLTYGCLYLLFLLGPGSSFWIPAQYLYLFFYYTTILSVGLAVFNLLPFPPLDGSKILSAFLPDKAWMWLMRCERYFGLVLFALLYLDVLDVPLDFLRGGLLKLVTFLPDLILNDGLADVFRI